MDLDRRSALAAGLGAGAGLALTANGAQGATGDRRPAVTQAGISASEFGIEPASEQDQTARLQKAIDDSTARNLPLWLPPGSYRTRLLSLPAGARIRGVAGASVLRFLGGGSALLSGAGATDIWLDGLTLDGDLRPFDGTTSAGLVSLVDCTGLTLRDLTITNSFASAISLRGATGRVQDNIITRTGEAAIFSIDAKGLEITGNRIADCANNGILVWRGMQGEDATIVSGNRIERIGALSGGSGQYGNGINVFRAGGVLITGNRINDCAYTAIRGNAASNIQMVANSCVRAGEVALYAEFGFEGALIANNLVDTAAAGISVTNFNEGGRLAVVQGNIIRNLFRREHEVEDKRGEGIAVEADATVIGNVVENAPTAGLMIGWQRYMREVLAHGNLIRNARIGIGVTGDRDAGAVAITGNMISGAKDGAIRAMVRHIPFGPDLADTRTQTARVTITGNVVV